MVSSNVRTDRMQLKFLISVSMAAMWLFATAPTSSRQADSPLSLEKREPSWTGYKLVWADEFNTGGRPDESNWTYERGFVRNEELQWYQPENARCENGLLIIEARREHKTNPRYRPNSRRWSSSRQYIEYTSSSLMTRGLHSWKFGRLEMRGCIDTRPGLWPAFWTLGLARSWPGCGEIDIMEYYRGMLLANAAWGSDRRWSAVWDDVHIPLDLKGGVKL